MGRSRGTGSTKGLGGRGRVAAALGVTGCHGAPAGLLARAMVMLLLGLALWLAGAAFVAVEAQAQPQAQPQSEAEPLADEPPGDFAAESPPDPTKDRPASDDAIRILAIFGEDSLLPANIIVAEGLQDGLAETIGSQVELFAEYLDISRFSDAESQQRIFTAMAAKYDNREPDVLVAFGTLALQFVLDHRNEAWLDGPVIFGATNPETENMTLLGDQVGGVSSVFEVSATIDLARALQPQAKRIHVISGAANFDRAWDRKARAVLGTSYHGLPVTYVTARPMEEILDTVADLDSEAIVLVTTIFAGPDGKVFVPKEALATISEFSGAPVYGLYDTMIGDGATGGVVHTFHGMGLAAGQLAGDVATGKVKLPQFLETPRSPLVDWRQLDRFGIDKARVPEGAQLLYYDPGFLERYRIEIGIALAVILAQSITITALIIQEKRRKILAEAHMRDRMELIHLARATQLGELSGALAHELNQPLASILANAEAGCRLLDRSPLDIAEMGGVMQDIIEADMRAAEIIRQLRSLMARGDITLEPLDLNTVVSATLALVRSELTNRQTRFEVRPTARPAMVLGNRPQLQQVLLNLVTNALDAMDSVDPSQRSLVIEVIARDDGRYEMAVIDSGRGFPETLAPEAFRPFVSSKAAGLGLGLSICRTIATAHDGVIDLDRGCPTGTRVALILRAA
ncbi:sensor histidine kinase [Pseudooceanicola algae]|uniref:histidine kinase n=1 Tax=Pseudooceanicola algae TaxID=1537215 RepID=A0A418SHX7_9RHOB|nr:ABC transporter substrate binding protein [Pseudooceanicola algae]QPM90274.1 Adaptive-response sensory-kinase SasA [Pseudooceanicola algae]